MQPNSLSMLSRFPLLLVLFVLVGGLTSAQKRPTYWGSYLGGNHLENSKGVLVAANGDILVVGKTQSSDLKTGSLAFQSKLAGRADAFVARLSGDGKRLLAMTYLGGASDDEARFVHEAKDGSIWVGGSTNSSTFPTTADAYAKSKFGRFRVPFLVQLDAKLTKLLYGTLYSAGSETDVQFFIDEKSSWLYIAGDKSRYNPINAPTTANALRRKGVNDECFFGILDRSVPKKTTLKYGTYVGGSGNELTLDGLSVDAKGVVTLSGTTASTDFPTTAGAFQTKRKGTRSGFIVSVDPAQSGSKGLVYGSYLGGSAVEYFVKHISDPQGLLHLALVSSSSDLPQTSQAVLKRGGGSDVFYVRLDPKKSGTSSVLYGSWIINGDKGDGDSGWGRSTLALHPRGVVFSGPTRSSWWTLPTMSQPFQRGLRDGVRCYVALLDTKTKSQPFLAYASEYGGIGWQGNTQPWGIVVHPSGDLILVGLSTKDLPVLPTAAQSRFGGRSYDGFVSRLGLSPWGSRFTSLGKSCMGSAGRPLLKGLTAGIGVRDGKPGSLGVEASGMAKNRSAALLIGSEKTWLSIPLPLKIGTTGCTLQASPILVFTFSTGAAGKWRRALPAPLDSSLVGAKVALQALIIDPKANSTQLVLTNGLLAELGW